MHYNAPHPPMSKLNVGCCLCSLVFVAVNSFPVSHRRFYAVVRSYSYFQLLREVFLTVTGRSAANCLCPRASTIISRPLRTVKSRLPKSAGKRQRRKRRRRRRKPTTRRRTETTTTTTTTTTNVECETIKIGLGLASWRRGW